MQRQEAKKSPVPVGPVSYRRNLPAWISWVGGATILLIFLAMEVAVFYKVCLEPMWREDKVENVPGI